MVRASLVLALNLSLFGCSLERATLGQPADAGEADAFVMDAPPPVDAGLDAADVLLSPDAADDAATADAGSDGGPPGAPTITGLTLWLDERGQEATSSQLTAWRDQSGAHHDLQQTNAAQRPATASTIAGYPAPTWDGVDDALVGPNEAALLSSTAASVTLVVNLTRLAPLADQYLFYSIGTGGCSILVSSAGELRGTLWNGTSQYATPGLPVAAGLHLVQLRLQSGVLSVRLDGGPAASVAAGAPIAAFGTLAVGGTADGRSLGFEGLIVFVATTSGDIDETENQLLRAFLAAKYGVTS